jgi:polyphosphate kinase
LGLRERIVELINQEISFAKQGKPARIIAKMNSLVDKDIVHHLYRASTAGVRVDLIVRGICVLRPGIPGISTNITVRSIVGRFLEHSRVFYFSGGGEEKCYLSSADWMPRNLNNRVELFFPVETEAHRKRILGILELLMSDNQKSHEMKPNGTYVRRKSGAKARINAQEIMTNNARANAETEEAQAWLLRPVVRPVLNSNEP